MIGYHRAVAKTRVLVICTGNRARSQMAEGWLRRFGGDDFAVFSAGTHPKGLHPVATEVMAERGVDISHQTSDPVTKYLGEPFDWVVTVCDSAKEACPAFPGARRTVHRSFRDPDMPNPTPEELRTVFREIRDEIALWAEAFVREAHPA
ncbi:MAG: arsenate reductase ArsC [Fimbriimonadaceae bacterium]|nr:arsenate reductase ArsC [Fimbriimonadaceae bacterium]